MSQPIVVENPEALERCVRTLRARSSASIYVDTEFDATRDGTTLCLVQLSDGSSIHLVDPFRVDVSPLAEVLGAATSEWVLHAGRQDVPLLCERLRIAAPARVFDTQIAWALTSPEANVSLAYVEHRLLGLRADKAHQADDWKRRPLGESQLAYAARDVEHLPELRRLLGARLRERDRERIALEASFESVWPAAERAAPLSLDSFRNAWQLDARGQSALRAIVAWTNALPLESRMLDVLPDNKAWLAIAARLPRTRDELLRIKGVPRSFVDAQGGAIVERLRVAASQADEASFVPLEPPAYASHADIRARARLEWLRADVCERLDVAPDVVLPSRLLDRMRAELLLPTPPERLIDLLTGFRRELLEPVWAECIALGPAF